MPDGKGAAGAGAYPALAGDRALEEASVPIYYVLNGYKAMPGFGGILDDEQAAAVVNYVRAGFGNEFGPPVTAADVRDARAADAVYLRLR